MSALARPRVRSALLWGLVAVLTVLVAVQGYRLVVGPLPFGIAAVAGVALLAGLGVATVSYLVEHRLGANGRT